MANQILGNTYILDTGSANTPLPWPNNAKVQAVTFWSSNTTGELVLSGVNTFNVVVRLTNPNDDPTTLGVYLGGINFTEIKLPTLTAGTAWIYFS